MAVRLAPVPRPSGALAPSRDRSLQDVRRLDWRFLLPEPRLERVAYLGPEEDALAAALREWSDALTVISTRDAAPRGPARDASFDLVVARWPGPAALVRARALLRRDGWLYSELAPPGLLPGRRRAGGFGALRGAPRAMRLLRELGFGDVEAHWHHPSFERCGWMVPLRHPSAREFLLVRAGNGLVPPVVARAAARMLGVGAIAGLLPCVSVVARRGVDA